jgi:hypothetical protein
MAESVVILMPVTDIISSKYELERIDHANYIDVKNAET